MDIREEGEKALACMRVHCRVLVIRFRRLAQDRHILVIAVCTGIATYVSIRWYGIGGILVSNGANLAKDTSIVLMDFEEEL